jgi:hypothetical protein
MLQPSREATAQFAMRGQTPMGVAPEFVPPAAGYPALRQVGPMQLAPLYRDVPLRGMSGTTDDQLQHIITLPVEGRCPTQIPQGTIVFAHVQVSNEQRPHRHDTPFYGYAELTGALVDRGAKPSIVPVKWARGVDKSTANAMANALFGANNARREQFLRVMAAATTQQLHLFVMPDREWTQWPRAFTDQHGGGIAQHRRLAPVSVVAVPGQPQLARDTLLRFIDTIAAVIGVATVNTGTIGPSAGMSHVALGGIVGKGEVQMMNLWAGSNGLWPGTRLFLVAHYVVVAPGNDPREAVVRQRARNAALRDADIEEYGVETWTRMVQGSLLPRLQITAWAHTCYTTPLDDPAFRREFQPEGLPAAYICVGEVSGARTRAHNTVWPRGQVAETHSKDALGRPSPMHNGTLLGTDTADVLGVFWRHAPSPHGEALVWTPVECM